MAEREHTGIDEGASSADAHTTSSTVTQAWSGGAWPRAIREFMARTERVAFVALLLLVGLAMWLGSVHVPRAEFSMTGNTDVLSTEFSADVDSDAILAPGLIATGLRRVESLDGAFVSRTPGELVRIDGKGALMTIPSLRVPHGIRLTLARALTPNRFDISLAGAEIRVRVLIPPGGTLTFGDGSSVVIDGVAPRPVELVSDATAVELSVALADAAAIDVFTAVPISRIGLWRIEPRAGTPGTRVSGIRGGTLTFLDTPDRPLALNKGDDLDVDLVDGVAHAVTLSPAGIEMNVSGRARDVRKRIGFSEPSRMPTWFDRLSGRPSIRVAAGLLTFLAGLEVHRLIRRRS